MTRRKTKGNGLFSRIARVERKCDRILSELLVIRQSQTRPSELDKAIDRMHVAARRMRRECREEYENSLYRTKDGPGHEY